MAVSGQNDVWTLLAVATAGNTLGSFVNWCLGRYLAHWRHHRWFPLSEAQYERLCRWFKHWSVWLLLLAWAPIIGDPLTVVAGILRVNVAAFLVIVAIGKALWYLLVLGAVTGSQL